MSRSEYGFHPFVIGFLFAMFVLAAVLNMFIYRGHNWARIVTLVLTLISLPTYLAPTDEPVPPSTAETVINVVVLLLEMAALYLVFTGPGASWFRRHQR